MFSVANMKSLRSGRPVANQFEMIMDTIVGHVILFQSYSTPIAMLIKCPILGTTYYIATANKYSMTTSKYQKIFYEKYESHLVHQYSVLNFTEWLDALNNQALFYDLLLKEKERQGASTR